MDSSVKRDQRGSEEFSMLFGERLKSGEKERVVVGVCGEGGSVAVEEEEEEELLAMESMEPEGELGGVMVMLGLVIEEAGREKMARGVEEL